MFSAITTLGALTGIAWLAWQLFNDDDADLDLDSDLDCEAIDAELAERVQAMRQAAAKLEAAMASNCKPGLEFCRALRALELAVAHAVAAME